MFFFISVGFNSLILTDSSGDVLDVLHVLLVLNCLLMLLWWQLAVTQSQREMTKPQAHQSKAPLYSCPKCTDNEKVKVHLSLMGSLLGEDWKSFLHKGAVSVLHCSDLQVVVYLLLILAGDVETNPGPGEN